MPYYVEGSNGIIEYELLEVERWSTKSELVAKTTAWEYYFTRIRPNVYHQNRTPYQRMKRAGISSKTAEAACLWTVTILDDPKFKEINFAAPQSVNHVPRLDIRATISGCCSAGKYISSTRVFG